MVDQATIAAIKDAVDIVQVIGDFIPLKRRGSDYVACCPFHQEKTPSFHVSPTRQYYNCFGCHEKGNAITFLMNHQQMSYVEALKYLGQKYGIEVRESVESAEEVASRNHQQSLLIINDYAQKFFTKALFESQEGQAVGLEYFKERKFQESIIKEFLLGYANMERDSLYKDAISRGYKKELLLELGLVTQKEDGPFAGQITDKFNERVIFPIRSVTGKVVAFGGRIMSAEKSPVKYMNSPESQVYSKKRVLYGLYESKSTIAQKKNCYLVEGYTDVISLHQAGIKNVVASCGTALTEEQVLLIKRFSPKVTIIYDGDKAGISASLKGINMFLEKGMDVKVALIPDGDDPDSFARKHTQEQIEEFLSNAEEDFILYQHRTLSKEIASDPFKEGKMINEIALSISMVEDIGIRSSYTRTGAKLLGIPQESLTEKVAQLRSDRIQKSIQTTYSQSYAAAARERAAAAAKVATAAKAGSRERAAKELYRSEQDLLYFLLRYGRERMRNILNSKVGEEQVYEPTVEEYIKNSLEQDGLEITDSVLRKIYQEYFSITQSAASATEIERHFMASMEQDVAKAALAILSPSFNFRSEKIKSSVAKEKDTLNVSLPRTIYVYKSKVIDLKIKELTATLQSAPSEHSQEIAEQLQHLTEVKKELLRAAKFA